MSQDERTIWTFSLIHCIRHNLSFRLRFSHPHYSSSHQRIWQCGIDLKGGREGGGPGLSYLSLSLYVSGNSSWSPLTAVQQGSHGSTSEWLLIEWEMKRTVVVPVQSPPPPPSSCLILLGFLSDVFLLPVYKSPSPHKETRSSDVLAWRGLRGEKKILGEIGRNTWLKSPALRGHASKHTVLYVTVDLEGHYRTDGQFLKQENRDYNGIHASWWVQYPHSA